MSGVRARRAVIADSEGPVAAVQALERRAAGLGTLARIVRGPVWLIPEADHERRLAALRLVRAAWSLKRRELLVWMPEFGDDAMMRALGMRRMVTGYTSAWIDLTRPGETLRASLNGRWRNMLKAAEAGNPRVETTTGPGAALDWLLERHETFRRARRFLAPDVRLIRAFAAAATMDAMVLRTFHDGAPVAAILMLRHAATATYYVGWSDDAGRRLRAHNLLLWRAMGILAKGGSAWLDVGGIDGHHASGVARFKLGMGGDVFTLPGTYI